MPVLRATYANQDGKPEPGVLAQAGPRIQVVIGCPPVPVVDPASVASLAPPDRAVWALIDTGATSGCVDEKVASELGLKVIDRQRVSGIAGLNEHNVYLIRIVVPVLNIQVNAPFTGVNLDAGTPVILGRDFLAGTIFVYDGIHGLITVCN